jgi:hypothetical protein
VCRLAGSAELRATAEASGEAAAAARALGEALRLLFDIDEDSPARAREELRLVQAALEVQAALGAALDARAEQ